MNCCSRSENLHATGPILSLFFSINPFSLSRVDFANCRFGVDTNSHAGIADCSELSITRFV